MGKVNRIGGRGPDRTRFAAHHRAPSPLQLEPPLGIFRDGSPAAFTPHAIDRIRAITSRIGAALPEIAAGKKFSTLYYEPTGFNFHEDSICLTVSNDDGVIRDGGYGEEWWDSTPEHPAIKALLDEFGPNTVSRPDTPDATATG